MGEFIAKLRGFFEGVSEEMKKCNWPEREQLFESTIVVIVALIILSVYVAGVDQILLRAVNLITTGSL